MSDFKTAMNGESMQDRLEEIIKEEKIKLDALEKKLKELKKKLEKHSKKD